MEDQVSFVVGNSYIKIPDARAVYDRSGTFQKTHDVTVYVDITRGNPDIIEKVTFDLGGSFQPSSFACRCPVPVTRPNGRKAWRFSTRQQVYGKFSATVKIRGCGGTVKIVEYSVRLGKSANQVKLASQTFEETRALEPLRMNKLSTGCRFGLELEMTSATHVSTQNVADRMPVHCDVVDSWRQGRASSGSWKLVPDGSIVCSTNAPSCNTFELVSPVLEGGEGLSRVSQVLRTLPPEIQVNKSMGFHVHIDVSNLSVQQLVKVCQNFCKYEDVMDALLPPSRRTGSEESNRYFKSNRDSVGGHTLRDVHTMLGACTDIESLSRLMNRDGRYYKLNMQNLVTGRQPTLEFRQHSATAGYSKVAAWVRFCVWLVHNSAKLGPPSPFAPGRSLNDQFRALFHFVIKDRALRDFYQSRREKLSSGEDDDELCCSGCAHGGTCQSRSVVPVYHTGLAIVRENKRTRVHH